MRKAIFLAVVIATWVGGLAGVWALEKGPAQEGFAAANAWYKEGKYDQAAQAYQKMIAQGYSSCALYYNLGNAHVKSGQIGKAVLAYERASRENPRDPEVAANLDYARNLSVDKSQDKGLLELLEKFSPLRWVSWREHVWAFTLVYWLGALLGMIGVLLKARFAGLWKIAVGILFLAAILGGTLLFRSPLWQNPRAIVQAQEVEVRYGPVQGESTAFTLHEGCKVEVLRSSGDWAQIFFSKGKVGWVPSEAIEKI